MGAPKQKWTSAEEAALKAGIAKYGLGKWSTILKDPEFSTVLQSRSNVDLKDKWRNINVMANGLGSRQRGRVALKSAPVQKNDENVVITSPVIINDTEVLDVNPLAEYTEPSQIVAHKMPISRLDDHILEALSKLQEPRGATRAAIAIYIEEHYLAPPNFDRILAAQLKHLTETGRLMKVKHQYKLAPSPALTRSENNAPLLLEGPKKDSAEIEKNGIKILTKAQIDAELEKMRGMSAKEAAAAAAQAIAEAEAAIADAEKAAKEAEEAEAEAEAAQCFAEAAMNALKFRSVRA